MFHTADIQEVSRTEISKEEVSVLRILLYFDIFKHPLLQEEIADYAEFGKQGTEVVGKALHTLCSKAFIQKRDAYYYINSDGSSVLRRLEGEKRAEKALVKAKWFSGLISHFPFVRCVCLSGSISKKYMDTQADIDYFVITTPRRMWICRTFLILFKKIFLLNSKKYFCVNYFVTTESLQIPDRNIFTATELAFLIPTYNIELYRTLMQENLWYQKFYPDFPLRDEQWLVPAKKHYLKPVIEKLLSGAFGERLDSYFFRLTLTYWKKKFSHFESDIFDMRMRSLKNESKHHPLGYQEKVLRLYEKNIADYELRYSVSLRP